VPTGSSVIRQSLIAGVYCNVTQGGAVSQSCGPWQPLYNVTISGGGVIDGNGHNWWFATDAGSPAGAQRPDMVKPAYVHGLVIRDVTLRASPSWTVHLLLSKNVHVFNVDVDAAVYFDDNEYLGYAFHLLFSARLCHVAAQRKGGVLMDLSSLVSHMTLSGTPRPLCHSRHRVHPPPPFSSPATTWMALIPTAVKTS
jgi:hypothetical protein